MLHALGWAGLLAGLAGCTTTSTFPRRTTLAADRVILPTTEARGLLLIEARIDGAGPYRLLVDTGAGVLLLSAKVVAEAGLARSGGTFVVETPAAQFRSGAAYVRRFESGGLRLDHLEAVVIDETKIAPIRDAFGAEGILGMAALRDAVLEMDFPAREVRVVRPDAFSGLPQRAVPYEELCPIVQLEVNGIPVRALVDTGSNFHLIVPELHRFPLVQPALQDDGLGGFALGTTTPDRGVNAQLAGTALLGPVRLVNPPLREQHDGATSNVGVRALEHCQLIVDQRNRQLYFHGSALERTWPQETVDVRFKPGFLVQPEAQGLRLLQVDPGCAFERAGLRAGDLLVAFDGQPELPQELAARPKWTVRAVRADRVFEVEVILSPAPASPASP
jgi:predicted aspartyl protease